MVLRHPRRRIPARASAALAVALLAGQAAAQERQVVPRIELREAFTDNARQTARDRKSDFVTTISPGIGVTSKGAGLKVDLDYALGYDAYLRQDDLNGVRHDLRGTGTAELLPDQLMVDFGAFAGQSPVLARGTTSAIDRRQADGGAAQFYSYALSPYWRTRLGSWADGEARYRFGQTLARRDGPDPASGSAPPLISDTDIHVVSGYLKGGENFDRLSWRLGAEHAETRVSDGTGANAPRIGGSSATYRRDTVEFQPGWSINRQVAVIGAAGHDRIESGDFRDDLSEPFWNAGLRLTPSERARLEFAYGERYGGSNWSSSGTATTQAGTSFTLSYREAVENQALQSQGGLSFLARDASGQIVDTRTGLPYVGRDPSFDQGDRTFLSRTLLATVRIPWPRDTLQFTAQHARRDTRFAGITTGTARDDTTIAAAGSWERRLTQVISSATTLSYSDTRSEQDGSASGDARTWTARVGLSWDINETLRAGAGIAHLRRDVSGPRFQPSEFSGSYDENVVFATLRKTF
jgi:uncharacterized protein (PEP-CTERM system associated)